MVATPPDEVKWIMFLSWIRKYKIHVKKEELEQIRLFHWIDTVPELADAFHIANERKCARIVGQILKLMGVRPGVPDVFIPLARGGYHGLFIEMKVGNNRPTTAQANYLARLTLAGYMAVYVVGYEAARATIETYLAMDKP